MQVLADHPNCLGFPNLPPATRHPSAANVETETIDLGS